MTPKRGVGSSRLTDHVSTHGACAGDCRTPTPTISLRLSSVISCGGRRALSTISRVDSGAGCILWPVPPAVNSSKGRRDWNYGAGGDVTERMERIEAQDEMSDRIESDHAREVLRHAMVRVRSRVEPQTWEAFRLLNLEGLTGEEAAKRLGMRLGTTYAASAKVRRLIREELALDAASAR
jgi:predicted DNA-binding protein (UPF0251 family)